MRSDAYYQWRGDIEALVLWAARHDLAWRRSQGMRRMHLGERRDLPMALVGTEAGTVLEVETPLGPRRAAIGDWIVCDGEGGFCVHPAGEEAS